MRRYIAIFFALLTYLFSSQLGALNRDYRSDCEKDNTYQLKINEYEVKAVFNKNLETGEIFLNDAWVIIK